jgi:hypothetical protein
MRLSWMVYAHSKFVPAGARLPFVIYLHHVAQACEPQDSQGKHTSHLARIPLVPTQVQENVKDISLVQAERMTRYSTYRLGRIVCPDELGLILSAALGLTEGEPTTPSQTLGSSDLLDRLLEPAEDEGVEQEEVSPALCCESKGS